jgi:hypothetical protein
VERRKSDWPYSRMLRGRLDHIDISWVNRAILTIAFHAGYRTDRTSAKTQTKIPGNPKEFPGLFGGPEFDLVVALFHRTAAICRRTHKIRPATANKSTPKRAIKDGSGTETWMNLWEFGGTLVGV